MHRLYKLILVVTLMLALPVATASSWTITPTELQLECYSLRNTSASVLETSILTTTIIPGTHRLIGFSLREIDATGSERMLSIIDSVPNGTGGMVSEVIAEAESREGESKNVFFPFGKAIHTQLTVWQGANTEVLVYYAR